MEAQKLLNERGFKVGAPDGKIGSKTKQAITSFQRSHGLPGSGTLTMETMAKLRESAGPTSAPHKQAAERVITMDGMLFHLQSPNTSKDQEILPRYHEIEEALSNRDYPRAKEMVSALLPEVLKRSPSPASPDGEKYAISLYRSLKYWAQELGVKSPVVGPPQKRSTYAGKVIKVGWGSGKNSTGVFKVAGTSGQMEFLRDFFTRVKGADSIQIGNSVVVTYEKTDFATPLVGKIVEVKGK